jgi:hypothetical protein
VLNGVAGETANELLETLRSGGRMVDLTGSATAVKPGILVDSEYVVRADAAGLGRLARMIDDALDRRRASQSGDTENHSIRTSAIRVDLCSSMALFLQISHIEEKLGLLFIGRSFRVDSYRLRIKRKFWVLRVHFL